jgi:hypothetical protein
MERATTRIKRKPITTLMDMSQSKLDGSIEDITDQMMKRYSRRVRGVCYKQVSTVALAVIVGGSASQV